MLNVLNSGKVLGTLENYFDMLTKTGYMKGPVTCRFLLYLFLYDFADTMYDYLSDEDYEKINKLLNATFSGAGCLLPYHNTVHDGIKVGTQRYEGRRVRRITETAQGSKQQITEDLNPKAPA